MKAVTKADIQRVYEKYIKGKPCLITSFVPKGKLDLIVEGSEKANVQEETIQDATQVEITDLAEPELIKTPTSFDRSVVPVDGPDPAITLPKVWKNSLPNGLQVYGIEQNELPLVQISIEIKD